MQSWGQIQMHFTPHDDQPQQYTFESDPSPQPYSRGQIQMQLTPHDDQPARNAFESAPSPQYYSCP